MPKLPVIRYLNVPWKDEQKEYIKKINLLGDFAVGKTSLIRQYVEGKFDLTYTATIGTNVFSKNVVLDDKNVRLSIHDLMGQNGYSSVAEVAMMGSTGAIGVCDVTRKKTLDGLRVWIENYRIKVGDQPVIIAVNKADMPRSKWEFMEGDVDSLSKELGNLEVILTSALDNTNVGEAFLNLAERANYASNDVTLPEVLRILKKKEYESPKDVLDALLAAFPSFYKIQVIRESAIRNAMQHSGIALDSIDEQGVYKVANLLADKLLPVANKEEHRAFVDFANSIIRRYNDKADSDRSIQEN